MRASQFIFGQPPVDGTPEGAVAEKQIFDTPAHFILAQEKGRRSGYL
jgi:hypothetical protein